MNLKDYIASIENYPQEGITFRDISLAKKLITARLMAIYHTRIQYPELSQRAKADVHEPSAAEKQRNELQLAEKEKTD